MTREGTGYHGGPQGIDALDATSPPPGGIGTGVYVATSIDTACFFAPSDGSIYTLRLKMARAEVFDLSPENTWHPEALEEHSVLSGEQVAPFSFQLGRQIYTVGIGEELSTIAVAAEIVREFARQELAQLWESIVIEAVADENQWPDAGDLDEKLAEVVDPEGDMDDAAVEAVVAPVRTQLQRAFDAAWAKAEKQLGLIIDLDDIGNEVRNAGFKAVFFDRGFEEILVFDPDDVEIIDERPVHEVCDT